MFKELKLKLKIILIFSITLTLCISSIIIYKLFSDILLSDFSQKSERYSDQIAQHIEMRLNEIEETVGQLVKKQPYEDLTLDPMKHYDMINNLREFTKYNKDISGAFFISNEKQDYKTSSKYNQWLEFLPSFEQISVLLSGKDKGWIYLNKENMSSVLLMIQPIYDTKNQLAGYLFIETNLTEFNNIINGHTNIFFKNPTVYLRFSDMSELLLSEGTDFQTVKDDISKYITNGSTKAVLHNNQQMKITPIGKYGISLVTHIPLSYIQNQMNVIRSSLFGIIIVALILAYWALLYIVRAIIIPLCKLYDNMQNYVN